ncbi:hypothetical protein ELD05_00595 [Caldicellulosiruptor changbaiensis]|uniref:Uncharacterized protein n=1 Tax=Caldicellulosiruptor changbaiensis TaxID=1222016 RepID=A0A3T0D221_9FIRM|nr:MULTISPECIES: hypothetical protein [Caldicellulosiruptor]AZT89301.1 hypothetical protein ELD05_00595 [Caldicellulosiruptor changbaiensis]
MIAFVQVEPGKKKMIVENGLSIENDYNKKIGLWGINVKCISGFLSPEPIFGDFVAVRVDTESSYIANYDLWTAFQLTKNEELNKMYVNSIVNFKRYRFGEYRIPEVLILSSIKKEDVLDISEIKELSDRILSKNDQIYISCLIERITQNPNIAKYIVLNYFDQLSSSNREITKKVVEKGDSKLYIFIQEDRYAWTVEI